MGELYQINTSVACEIIDSEAIIIHFETGNYYSTKGLGVSVWNALIAGISKEEIICKMMQKNFQENELSQKIEAFINKLLQEGLIAVRKLEVSDSVDFSDDQLLNGKLDSLHIETYSDMSEMLLLDPIHDVDQEGWPAKNGNSKQS